MYPNDDHFTNKSNNNFPSSIAREITTFSHAIINSSQFSISSNHHQNNHNNHNNYEPLHDLPSLNPNHAPLSPSNILCSNNSTNNNINNDNNQEYMKDDNEEEQEIRRLKRMISNRESARRSRLRKRKQLENLQQQVYQLLAANHQLADKFNQVMESNYQILQENAQLRQDAATLQKTVTDLLMSMKGGAGLEEGANQNQSGLRIRASQTITSASITSTSMDVLHQ